LYGIPIPKDMDGRVLTEMIKEDYLKEHPIMYLYEDSQKRVTERQIVVNETIKQNIEKRLKELGYLV
jgi:CheY-like chemotaxis protein